MNTLKVIALPLDIVWADIEENIYSVGRTLATLDKDTDLVVLPELFSTGFISNEELLHKFAEDADESYTLKQIHLWAEKYNFAIAGTFLVREGDNFYNRGFFIEPSGDETFYDKTHLFGLSAEAQLYSAGSKKIPVVRFRGWNIALAICYELRFPSWLRNVEGNYDLLIIPANWPNKRSYAWEHLLIARAIENQAYVIGANRSGKDDSGEYDSTTFIFNYLGKSISESSTPEIISAVLNRDKLHSHRKRFPFLADADSFKLV